MANSQAEPHGIGGKSYPLQQWLADYQWYCEECQRVFDEDATLTYPRLQHRFLAVIPDSELANYRAVRFWKAIAFLNENKFAFDFGKAAVIGQDGHLISIEIISTLHSVFASIPDDALGNPIPLEAFVIEVKKALAEGW